MRAYPCDKDRGPQNAQASYKGAESQSEGVTVGEHNNLDWQGWPFEKKQPDLIQRHSPNSHCNGDYHGCFTF